MKKRFMVILGLTILFCLITSAYSFAGLPDVPEVGPGSCVDTPEMPCSTASQQTVDEETPEMDIGQVQTSGIETVTYGDGTTQEIDYDELKKYQDDLRKILACPLPKVIDGDARCAGMKISEGQACYLSSFNEQIYADDEYETCISSTGGPALAEVTDKEMEFGVSCPIFPSGEEYQSCNNACPTDNNDVYQACRDICDFAYHKQLFDYIKCGVQAHAATRAYFQKWLEEVNEEIPEEKEKIVTPEPEPTPEQKEEKQNAPEMTVAEEVLLEAVLGKHKQEVKSIQDYYTMPRFQTIYDKAKEEAQKKFEETRPLGLEVVNAKGDYQDALKKGVSGEELMGLKNAYDSKIEELKTRLQDQVLTEDGGNADALWQLGTLSKWQGDNKQSYEYYRDALSSERSRDIFTYNKRLDLINDPAMRMELLQRLAPNEKVITLPTTETSPLLKWLDGNLKKLVKPVTEKKRQMAEEIEKISRAFSLSNQLPEEFQEFEEK